MLNPFPLQRCRGMTLTEVIVAIGIIAVLAVLLLRGWSSVRHAMAQTQCVSNMRSIGQAILLYTTEHGCFPGGGPDGGSSGDPNAYKKRWFAQVAVFMGHPAGGSYDGVAVSEDHPYFFEEFLCPARLLWKDPPASKSTVLMKYGRYGYNPLLEGPIRGMKGVPLSAVTSPATTVLLAETFGNSPSLRIATFPADERGVSANHRKDGCPQHGPDGTCNYLFCDGRVEVRERYVGNNAFTLDP
jgi:prepilin-type N-terminal cleavage/methylation domain-containing protein/prepilin-type processing-associated H-X9-DG protein